VSNRFAIGTEVMWNSQAQGYWKVKKGTVIAFVPAGDHIKDYFDPAQVGAKKSHIKFDYQISPNDRYIVAVPAGKDGQITHYYAPPAKRLEKAR